MASEFMEQTPLAACTLLSSGFDGAIQIILGLLALSILIIKRYTETPMRPFKIW